MFRSCLLLLALLAAAAPALGAAAPRTVTYDKRSLLLSGQRALLSSGSLHYQRIVPADWPRALALAKELGLNTVQTYVFADQHYPTRDGPATFAGQQNLTAFTALAQSLGLHVVVRIGPYACGEHFNGGVPQWMRTSGAACFRCSDAVWEAFSVRVLTDVVGQLTAAQQLYPQGGPVILLQVENEYGGPDLAYLKYMVAAARNITTAVPWILCHDQELCSQVNAGAAEPLALCTINGFWEEQLKPFVDQPSPSWVAAQNTNNPTQPFAWTEDQGWFDQWGLGQRIRHTSDILYGISRALAYGLSFHNFYMLSGGSNFGYSAAWGVTTAYAPDTAIDSYLLRHEPKFSTFQAFFAAVEGIADVLLGNPVPLTPTPLGASCQLQEYGPVAFVSNLALGANGTEVVSVHGQALLVPNHTVIILSAGRVVFNTSAALDAPRAARPAPALQPQPLRSADWVTVAEELGYGQRSAAAAPGALPLEQLNLTENLVDYMYYTLELDAAVNASDLSVGTCGGEYVYVFVGGARAPLRYAHAPPPRAAELPTHHFALPPAASPLARVSILVSAMGLSTSPSPASCKGLRHVSAGGQDLSTRGWTSRWVFAGEAGRWFTAAGSASAPWAPVAVGGGSVPTSWFKALLPHPAPAAAAAARLAAAQRPQAPPPQLAYALDMQGATKGVAWVNGFNIGRYNLEAGHCTGECAPPFHGPICYIFWRNCNSSTQRFYAVPESVLVPGDNLVVLFEEAVEVPSTGGGPVAPSPPPLPAQRAAPPGGGARDLSTVALVALTEHP